jgi:hypothetical protein
MLQLAEKLLAARPSGVNRACAMTSLHGERSPVAFAKEAQFSDHGAGMSDLVFRPAVFVSRHPVERTAGRKASLADVAIGDEGIAT